MDRFNHLDLPHRWKDYWTRYPEGYTILEALVKWVSQVNDMVDHVNEWSEWLELFVERFDEALKDEVRDMLNQFKDDGTLDEIINEVLFGELNQQIKDLENVTPGTDGVVTTLSVNGHNGERYTTDYRDLTDQVYYNTGNNEFNNYGTSEDGQPLTYYSFGQGDKKLLVVTGLHGNEKTPVFAMLDLYTRYFNGDLTPAEKNVVAQYNIHWVPVANPYGFNNNQRDNVNGIDLNRNFSYNFNENGQGTAPYSESEAQALYQLMNTQRYHFVIDLHTIVSTQKDFVLFYPRPYSQNNNKVFRMLDRMKLMTGGQVVVGSSTLPGLMVEASTQFRAESYLLEYYELLKSNTRYDHINTSFYYNIMINLFNHMSYDLPDDPIVHHYEFSAHRNNGSPYTITTTGEEVSLISYRMDRPIPYNAHVDQDITITLKSIADTELRVIPQLFQNWNFMYNYEKRVEMSRFSDQITGGQYITITLKNSMFAFKSSEDENDERSKNLISYVNLFTSLSQLNVHYLSIKTTFTPANSSVTLYHYRNDNGLTPETVYTGRD